MASRQRSTFWWRVVAALVALVIGCGFFAFTLAGAGGFGPANMGKALFGTLTWLSLAVALAAGLFFTSDCLSEEKREGTLGFLFLTDLRGYDVVLGKLLSTSLRSFYALLAVFPILAVTLLMGGVAGAQFWMTLVALVNALFLSLAAGLFVSAISRESQKALAATLLLLLLLAGGGPAMDATFASIEKRSFEPVLSVSSPVYLFVTANGWGGIPFWPGLLVNQFIAWLLLGSACLLLPRSWQERVTKSATAKGSWGYAWKFGGAKSRATLRRKLLELNPILWLACRERWQTVTLWGLTILMVGGFMAMFTSNEELGAWYTWSFWSGLLTIVFYLALASHASRFFVEAQRSGLMELLLATPLTVRQIVQGQWRGLLRMFGLPLALCLAVQLFGTYMVQQMTYSRMAAPAPAARTATTGINVTAVTTTNMETNGTVTTTRTVGGKTVSVSTGGYQAPGFWVMLAVSVVEKFTVVANLVAVCWFGMWMGLNSKSANAATLKTILFVQIIPWFVGTFAQGMVIPLLGMTPRWSKAGGSSQMMMWYPLLTSGLGAILYLTKDIVFALWARRKLYAELRERTTRVVAPIQSVTPPPLPRMSLPPVVG